MAQQQPTALTTAIAFHQEQPHPLMTTALSVIGMGRSGHGEECRRRQTLAVVIKANPETLSLAAGRQQQGRGAIFDGVINQVAKTTFQTRHIQPH
jgi:hypothetical protein